MVSEIVVKLSIMLMTVMLPMMTWMLRLKVSASETKVTFRGLNSASLILSRHHHVMTSFSY